MTSVTTIVRAHRRSLTVVVALVALVLAASTVAVLVTKTSPTHGRHDLVNRHHHLPHLLQVLFDGRRLGS